MAKFSERVHALTLLRQWVRTTHPPEDDPTWPQATPLTRELVLGCLRHKGLLDAVIGHLSARPPAEDFRPVLWLGLAQILILDGIAPHAAVHETLEAAQKQKIPKAKIGYANGLLRNVLRRQEEIRAWLTEQPLHVRSSHPEILVRRWSEAWGVPAAEGICDWNQRRSPTFARKTRLGAATPIPDEVEAHAFVAGFHRLPRGMSPTDLPGFAAGHWYVQDPSTSFAPALLNPKTGERVLDACAAPGGKTSLLADALGNGGEGLTALEPHPKRMERLRENLTRLRLDRVRTLSADLAESPRQRFDALLLDVPCSNTGVLQRRPDARWRFSKRSLADLARLQAELLAAAGERVELGGRMVYSTCSIEPEETTRQIQNWLKTHPEWRLAREFLLLPGEQQCDGAYAALLQHAEAP